MTKRRGAEEIFQKFNIKINFNYVGIKIWKQKYFQLFLAELISNPKITYYCLSSMTECTFGSFS